MKYIIVVFMLWISTAHADEWTTLDKTLATTAIVATTIDWGQTRNIVKHPTEFHEMNPLLGEHPSMSHVNRHFIGSILISYLIADNLSPNWRTVFLVYVTTIEIVIVSNNYHIGLGFGF